MRLQKNFLIFTSGLFLLTQASIASMPQPTPESIEQGQSSYQQNCLMCHGPDLTAQVPAGQAMNASDLTNTDTTDYEFHDDDREIGEILYQGITEGVRAMPSFGHLSEDERWALVHYILEHQDGDNPSGENQDRQEQSATPENQETKSKKSGSKNS